MENSLTDTELNKWAAEFVGIAIHQMGPSLLYPVQTWRYQISENAGWGDWTPCTDRNQAQMVVEKFEHVSINQYGRFLDRLPSHEFDPLDFLLSPPRQLVEAAYKACHEKV